MISFEEYVRSFRESLLLLTEMPRRRDEDTIRLGPEDDEYLEKLPKETSPERTALLWAAAIRAVYNPNALMGGEEKKDVDFSWEGRKFKITVNVGEIRRKIENISVGGRKIDLNKLDLSVGQEGKGQKMAVSRRMARNHLDYKNGNGKKPGAYSPPEDMLVGVERKASNYERLGAGGIRSRSRISFNEDDLAYLKYFRTKQKESSDNVIRNDKGFLTRALMKRYSPYFIQEMERTGSAHPNMEVVINGRTFHPPVFPTRLKKRLEHLANEVGENADFLNKPMSRATAKRWLRNQYIVPNHATSEIVPNNKRREEIESQYLAHKADPENTPSPNDPDKSRLPERPQKTWYDLVTVDIIAGVRNAVRAMDARMPGQLTRFRPPKTVANVRADTMVNVADLFDGSEFMDLVGSVMQQVYTNLSGDVDYTKESFRLHRAEHEATEYIKKYISQTRLPTTRTGAGQVGTGGDTSTDLMKQFAAAGGFGNFDDSDDGTYDSGDTDYLTVKYGSGYDDVGDMTDPDTNPSVGSGQRQSGVRRRY